MGNHFPKGHFSPDMAVLALITQPHSLQIIPILLSQLLQSVRLSSFTSLLMVNQRDLFLFSFISSGVNLPLPKGCIYTKEEFSHSKVSSPDLYTVGSG